MATNSTLQCVAYAAGADLSAKQFTFVKLSADETVVTAAADGIDAIGILQNTPKLGQAASVAFSGQSKVVFAAAVASGNVTCDAAGKVVASATGKTTLGVVSDGVAKDSIGSILLVNKGVSA